MTPAPTFTRRAVNALVAQARGDFKVYAFRCSRQKPRFMLHDHSHGGLWSHLSHSSPFECLAQNDKEAAAAPYATCLPLVGPLICDLLERGVSCFHLHRDEQGSVRPSDERALLITLLWLKEVHGVRIERDQVISDLEND